MLQITETKINWIRKNKYQDLSVTLLIKKEDYTKEMEDTLFDSCADGTLYACVLSQFQNEREETEREKTNKLKQKLAYLMQSYCDKENIPIEKEIETLYTKYNVTSRANLSKEQILKALSSYEAGLL